MRKIAAIVIISALICSACYGLGLFGGGGVTRVTDKDYGGEFVYGGDLNFGRFEGEGVTMFADGGDYSGGFAAGRFDGAGVYNGLFVPADGGEARPWRFSGIFADGKVVSGVIDAYNGVRAEYERSPEKLVSDDWRYVGGFGERGQSGDGEFTVTGGYTYVGGFYRGLADGFGSLTGKDGVKIYSGDFKNGLFDGQGAYFAPDGAVYEGGFKDGLPDGDGTVTGEDGQVLRGRWERGERVEIYE